MISSLVFGVEQSFHVANMIQKNESAPDSIESRDASLDQPSPESGGEVHCMAQYGFVPESHCYW